jgi:hypothetical protein
MFELGGEPFLLFFDYMYYQDKEMMFRIKYRWQQRRQRKKKQKLVRKPSKKTSLDTIKEI